MPGKSHRTGSQLRPPGRRCIRTTLALLALLLAFAPARSQDIRAPGQEESRVRLRFVRLRIDPTTAADPGECLALGPADLKVTVGGKRVPADRVVLEREEQPTLHALLIDSSRSMYDWMDGARRAVDAYVALMDPELDSSLMLTFDASVLLELGATRERAPLRAAMETLQLGDSTLLYDGLYHTIGELGGRRQRSVILLVTDGQDTGSVHQPEEILDRVDAWPDVSVFTIGLGMGVTTARAAMMEDVAQRSHGKFFPVPGGAMGRRLETIFREIRELLDNEATLIVNDPAPHGPPRRVRASSRSLVCDVKVLGEISIAEAPRTPAAILPADQPRILAVPPARRYKEWFLRDSKHVVDPPCQAVRESAPSLPEWFLEAQPDLLRGCLLDVALEPGLLYSDSDSKFVRLNSWMDLRTRMVEVPVPARTELARRPEDLLPALARRIPADSISGPYHDPLDRKGDHMARPYDDLPMLAHGVTFLEVRPVLAEALFQRPDYRDWALARIKAAADRELAALEEEFRALAPPEMPDEQLLALVHRSPEGNEILRWAASPTAADLTDHLAAWLGDIPAHDLLARWEERKIDRRLRDPSAGYDAAADEWARLHSVLELPSHARVLTILSPVYDEATDRIGFWRVILPRPSWMGRRIAGRGELSAFGTPPLDLVPRLPLALWSFDRALADRPELEARLRDGGHRVTSVSYETLVKPRAQSPLNAFAESRVTILLEPPDGAGAAIRIVAELLLAEKADKPRLRSIVVE